jgi:hypothetical protein
MQIFVKTRELKTMPNTALQQMKLTPARSHG